MQAVRCRVGAYTYTLVLIFSCVYYVCYNMLYTRNRIFIIRQKGPERGWTTAEEPTERMRTTVHYTSIVVVSLPSIDRQFFHAKSSPLLRASLQQRLVKNLYYNTILYNTRFFFVIPRVIRDKRFLFLLENLYSFISFGKKKNKNKI